MADICAGVHESIFTDLTNEMWVPKPLCCPLHSKQTKMPRVTEAHSGDIRPQSMQRLFPGIALSMAWSCGLIIIMSVLLDDPVMIVLLFVYMDMDIDVDVEVDIEFVESVIVVVFFECREENSISFGLVSDELN